MNREWDHITGLVQNFMKDRPAMAQNNADLLRLLELKEGEGREVSDAGIDYIIDPSQENLDSLGDELADDFLFSLQIALNTNIDLFIAIITKVAYNISRYIASAFKEDMDYNTGRKQCRDWVAERDFKDQVFERGNYAPQSVTVYEAPRELAGAAD